MNTNNYKAFLVESSKITLCCLTIAGLFALCGAEKNTLLLVFTMAVLSAVATFSINQKHLNHVVLGSSVIIVSIIAGGIIGFYSPEIAKILTILYSGLAFYLSKTKYHLTIFATGSLMFLIYSALPFNLKDGIWFSADGIIVFAIFIAFYFLFDHVKANQRVNREKIQSEQLTNNHITAIMVVISLTIAWSLGYVLSVYYQFSHLYWIPLTALMIIQSSQGKTIQTSLKRIIVNAVGALFIVILFNYVMPPNFYAHFFMLTFFLFMMFFLSFSYVGRTLFIELFVLALTFLLGDYTNAIAMDRAVLTLLGGLIVIVVTPISILGGQESP